jgi:bla regulator protein blaR1
MLIGVDLRESAADYVFQRISSKGGFMTRMFAGMNLIVFAACAAFCQSAAPVGFELASIKPSDPAALGMQIDLSPGGLFTAKNVTVKILIEQAYDVRDFQISGGPGWLSTERYDIAAKGDGSGVSEDDMRKMTEEQRNRFQEQFRLKVRALLADRFQLKVHQETKELPVYALIVAKNGPRIQAATDDGSPGGGLSMRRGDAGKAEITGKKVALAPLVQLLSNQVGRTVLDRTGLKGNYDFKMTFAPDLGLGQQPPGPRDGGADRPPAVDTDGPSIFTALQEQLGLKLDAQKGPVEVVVIDGVQKASEN